MRTLTVASSGLPAFPDSLLSTGQLSPVPAIAETVLGHRVDPRTVLRWTLVGRNGVQLPTVRGTRRRHFTTAEAFKAWLVASSGCASATHAAPPQVDAGADAILAALNPKLARRGV